LKKWLLIKAKINLKQEKGIPVEIGIPFSFSIYDT
jgi:hypothetical protein